MSEARKPVEYDLRVRVLPGDDSDEQGIRRLRSLLKAMVRSWRLRCVRIVTAIPDEDSKSKEAQQ